MFSITLYEGFIDNNKFVIIFFDKVLINLSCVAVTGNSMKGDGFVFASTSLNL